MPSKDTLELREIPGYEGVYAARSDGAIVRLIRSSGTQAGRVLKGTQNKRTGYIYYFLSVNAKVRAFSGQTLVAAAFHGPRPAGMDVMHMNADKHDNRANNLKYGTRSENQLHAVQTGHHQSCTSRKNAPGKSSKLL